MNSSVGIQNHDSVQYLSSLERWSQESTQCPRDRMIQYIAAAALAALALGLGAVLTISPFISLIVMYPVSPVILLFFVACSPGGIFLGLTGATFPFVYVAKQPCYEDKKTAKEIVQELKSSTLDQFGFAGKFDLKALRKYGFISDETTAKITEMVDRRSTLSKELFKATYLAFNFDKNKVVQINKNIREVEKEWMNFRYSTLISDLPKF